MNDCSLVRYVCLYFMIFKNELFLSTPFILPETFFLLILSFHTWGNAEVLILNHVILVSVLCVGVGRRGDFG